MKLVNNLKIYEIKDAALCCDVNIYDWIMSYRITMSALSIYYIALLIAENEILLEFNNNLNNPLKIQNEKYYY